MWKGFYKYIACNRKTEENASLLLKEEDKLMIQKTETFTIYLTILLLLPYIQKIVKAK